MLVVIRLVNFQNITLSIFQNLAGNQNCTFYFRKNRIIEVVRSQLKYEILKRWMNFQGDPNFVSEFFCEQSDEGLPIWVPVTMTRERKESN